MNTNPHRRPHARLGPVVALAAAAGLALTGCTGTVTPSTAPPPEPGATSAAPGPGTNGAGDAVTVPDGAVAWTGTVCDALTPVVDTLRTPPQIDVTDPAAAQQAYSAYLTEAQSRAVQAQQQVAAAGAPPVENGEQLAQEVQEQVDDLQQDVVDAQGQIGGADPGNPLSVGQAVAVTGNVLGAVGNSVQALGSVVSDSELAAAFDRAPACRNLRTLGDPS